MYLLILNQVPGNTALVQGILIIGHFHAIHDSLCLLVPKQKDMLGQEAARPEVHQALNIPSVGNGVLRRVLGYDGKLVGP